jgi:hypothetical protein
MSDGDTKMGRIAGLNVPIVIKDDFLNMPHPIDFPRVEVDITFTSWWTNERPSEKMRERIRDAVRDLLLYPAPTPYCLKCDGADVPGHACRDDAEVL